MRFHVWLENQRISAAQVFQQVKQIHYYEDDLYAGDLGERIYKFPEYELRTISMSQLDLSEWSLEEDRVVDIMREVEANPNYPPIVYDPEEGSIIDGLHRANALSRLRHTMVKAYVGIK
jgi:hypothetical protein